MKYITETLGLWGRYVSLHEIGYSQPVGAIPTQLTPVSELVANSAREAVRGRVKYSSSKYVGRVIEP